MPSGRESAAEYISAMAGELSRMATRAGLHDLAFQLEMAAAEADEQRGVIGPSGPPKILQVIEGDKPR